MTDHLRPSAAIAPDALLPGDPGRALTLAQELLEAPRMANHARGLWGYSGTTSDGHPLTIQSTGLGGPSVAVVLEELAELGVLRAVRVGTGRGLTGELGAGSMVIANAAIAGDGASAALGAGALVEPDVALTAALLRAESAATGATVASTDLYYDPDADERERAWLGAGAEVVDLGTAAALALGRRLGLAVASALVIVRAADGAALGEEDLEAASLRLGRAAAAALPGAPAGAPEDQAPASGAARLA